MPASLASVSGAKPVQPEMAIATLVSAAEAEVAPSAKAAANDSTALYVIGNSPQRKSAEAISAQIAGMAQRITPRLRPHGEAVRLLADLDLVDGARAGVDAIDHVV